MKRSGMSIRSILRIAIGALMLLIMFQAGRTVFVEWRTLSSIQGLEKASALSDRLFAATERLSVERDIAATLLRVSKANGAGDMDSRLAESRAQTDEAMQAAEKEIDRYGFTDLETLRNHIATRLEAIQALRKRIDDALSQPLATRDRALGGEWYKETSDLIVETQKLWSGFVRHFTGINPVVTQHIRYKHLMRSITDYSGRERALIGQLIAQNASPTPEEFATLLKAQGFMEMSWEMSNLLADQSGLYPAILPHYQEARSHYLNLHDMIRPMFYTPGAPRLESYPLDADLWLELSTQAAESLGALKAAAVKEAAHYMESLAAAARRTIAWHAVFLLFASALCSYSFWMVSHRVIRPIDAIVHDLVDVMEGKPVAVKFGAVREDEIGRLEQVLAMFQLSNERYRALVQASSQIIWTWNPHETGEMKALWEWWEKTTGQPGERMANFGWLEVVHPDDRETARKIWTESSTEGRDFEMEYRIRARSGDYRWIYVRGVATTHADGSVREFVGAVNDITARKDAEEAMRTGANRLKAVIDTVLDGIIMIDRSATIQSFNAAAERIFGYKADEVIGKNVNMLMPEPYHSEHDRYVGNYLSTGQAKIIWVGREVTAKRKDGSVFPMELGISLAAFVLGGVRNSPMSLDRVTGKDRAAFTSRIITDGNHDIHIHGLEYVPRLAFIALRADAVPFQRGKTHRIHFAHRKAAGAEGTKLAFAMMFKQPLGHDAAAGVACTEEQDALHQQHALPGAQEAMGFASTFGAQQEVPFAFGRVNISESAMVW
jgi:PAS domain S-box-containing protein